MVRLRVGTTIASCAVGADFNPKMVRLREMECIIEIKSI